MECYSQMTATFMILGDVCTRSCRFCSVRKGTPGAVDENEPRCVAEAVRTLGLRHAVVTCVTRDDLPDGGAEHFCRTIGEIRRLTSGDCPNFRLNENGTVPFKASPVTIEVLPSDFAGNAAAVDRLIEAAPDVYNHNTETVPRLFASVRGRKANYRWTLTMFRRIRRRNPNIQLKTGLMLGLGETVEESSTRWPSCAMPAAGS